MGPQDDKKLIKADGEVQDYPPQGKTYTLQELQEAVGGYIEVLRLKDGYLMVINEEGRLQDLPFNPGASLICQVAGLYPYLGGSDIRGDVVVCHGSLVD
ncbi:MAG: DUF3846 domain-containing protein [Dehalococcoidia bacterium]|nr:DUF3846 domain-containing protein [Dehalococcoidia bacterium]